jgi:flagellar basal body-associated protein FliL
VAEVPVLKNFRVPNDKTGRLFIYDVDLSVVVPLADKDKAEALVKEKLAAVGDHVARVIRGASERVLREDDLRALREQLLDALREALGEEETIQRVLIPRLVPLRSD